LDKINSLDDVDMMQCRGDAEFCHKLLDVFFFRFILVMLPELLRDEGRVISILGPIISKSGEIL